MDENSAVDTVIGTLMTVDQDKNQQYKYTILDSGSGDGQIFKIDGDKLVVSILSSFSYYLFTITRLN